MSDLMSKLYPPIEYPSSAPGSPRRARQTLQQLRSGGLGLEVLESDGQGPLVVLRRSMRDSTWRRVGGSGLGGTYEVEG